MFELAKKIVDFVQSEKLDTTISDIVKVVSYLQHYGYLVKNRQLNVSDVIDAVAEFQAFIGLKKDGVPGPKTLSLVNTPRCGCPDFENLDGTRQPVSSINYWEGYELTYYIKSRDTDMSASDWDAEKAAAFNAWEKVANLKFVRVNRENEANLILDTGYGRRDGFDGPGGTLAWAYLPPRPKYSGQLLTKDDRGESWITRANRGRGIVMAAVGCHEIGHLLGLGHSRVNSALMAPYYNRSIWVPQRNDDIPRIQRLYGKPIVPQPPEPEPPQPEPPQDDETLTIVIKTNGIESLNIPGYRVQKLG